MPPGRAGAPARRVITRAALLVIAMAMPLMQGCIAVCLSCACSEDEDCIAGWVCNQEARLCEEPACSAHDDCARCDFVGGVCTAVDVCRSNDECADDLVCDLENRHCVQDACDGDDDCTNFTVCDLENRRCVPDACVTDDDCELEEAPRCDVDDGVCVAP